MRIQINSLLLEKNLSTIPKSETNNPSSNQIINHEKKNVIWDFPGGPVAKTPHFQCKRPGFNPWSGNQIPFATTKSLHTATEDPTCHEEDQRPHVLQLRLLLLLLSHFSHVRFCVTPQTAAHQASPSLGFSRQEPWSGLPFPSPMHESEKGKSSRSVVSDSQRPHGLQPTRLLRQRDFPGKSTGVGCHCLLLQLRLGTAK